MADSKTVETPANPMALFADFGDAMTIQDSGERPLRAISTEPGDGGVPQQVLDVIQYLYDNGQKQTVSFRGDKLYFGLKGEAAAKQYVNDAKDSAPHVKARAEHPNGVTVAANADGIVVTVTVGKKRGRTPGTPNGDATK
jgi:hypothetical protein